MLGATLIALLAASEAGCGGSSGPEQVADAFVDAYFRRADQEKAKEHTALGASAMLDDELRSVAQIRKDGYTPQDARAAVSYRRGTSTKREQRVRVPYEITIQVDATKTVRDADIELARLDGAWKVVRVGLTTRP